MNTKDAFTVYFLFFLFLIAVGCSVPDKDQIEKDIAVRQNAKLLFDYGQIVQKQKKRAVADYVDSMSADEKIAQLFIVNLEGDSDFEPVDFFADGIPAVSGSYLFFSYNIADSPLEIMQYTESIIAGSLCEGSVPPLLMIDHEGGDVNRLKKILSPLPSAESISSVLTPLEAQGYYRLQGEQMSALGFHLNLAPVAETAEDENKLFLGSRSYGNLSAVKSYASAAVSGYKQAGVGSAVKHFPGNTNTDPHSGLPEITLSSEELYERYIMPFEFLLWFEPAGILMSHARTLAHDGDTPACLSSYWIGEALRGNYGYEGLIISDDIYMSALEKNGFSPERSVTDFINAGGDLVMLSEKRFSQLAAVIKTKMTEDEVFRQKVDKAAARILSAKAACGLMRFDQVSSSRSDLPVEIPVFELVVNTSRPDEENRMNRFNTAYEEGMRLYNSYFGAK